MLNDYHLNFNEMLDENYIRILKEAPNAIAAVWSFISHLRKIHIRPTRHTGYNWRRKDELRSDILLWTTTHGYTHVGRPSSALYGQWMKWWELAKSDDWLGWMTRESQRNTLLMIIIMIISILIISFMLRMFFFIDDTVPLLRKFE